MKKSLAVVALCAALLIGITGCSTEQKGNASEQESTSAKINTTAKAVATTAAETTPAVTAAPFESDGQKHLVTLALQSEAIAPNLLKRSAERTLTVYLPPSYYTGSTKYPVVYYLHGFGETVGAYVSANCQRLDDAFANGSKEFIMVEVDGGYSYYVNSPVTGNWEDYVIKEAVPLIDKTYRTLPDAASRGICGFSMGGFGAINLSFLHPDVFGATYAMSPGLLAENDLKSAMNTWQTDAGFLGAYGQAFSPDINAKSYCHIPKMDGTAEDNVIAGQWENGFGNLKAKLDAYLALGKPLKGIGLSYGKTDSYGWIPTGTKYFSELLTQNSIENALFTFDGGHQQPPNAIANLLAPFFNTNLQYQ